MFRTRATGGLPPDRSKGRALDSHIVPLSKRQRYEMARLGTLCVVWGGGTIGHSLCVCGRFSGSR